MIGIMRLKDVEQATGFKVSQIYNLMKEGKFPQSRRIGSRAVGWDSTEIQQWVDEKLNGQKPAKKVIESTPTTLRDTFAMAALPQILAAGASDYAMAAYKAYKMADAMLLQRELRTEQWGSK